MSTRVIIVALAGLWISPCLARTIIVDDNGPADFNNIQAAINDADNGDIIDVRPGIYYENIKMKTGIILQGSGADSTTIDGTQKGHVVSFNLASATITGFTIKNSGSNPAYSAGIFTSQSTVIIKNNVVINNNFGIMMSSNSDGTVAENKITGCTGTAAIKIMSSNPVITNNLVTNNSWHGISCDSSSPSIINNTISNNVYFGLRCNPLSGQVVINNIITNNEYGILVSGGDTSSVPLVYIANNNIWNNAEGNYWEDYGIIPEPGYSGPFIPIPRTGELNQQPFFVNSNAGDYHLQSAAGRWDPITKTWIKDVNTSPCIDAGDPNSDWTKELWPHGKRINMGAYGGTPEASMSLSAAGNIANLDNDPCDTIDLNDLDVFMNKWCYQEYLLAEDLDRNGRLDFNDFAIFARQYDETHAEFNISYNIGSCTEGISQNTPLYQTEETRFTVTAEGRRIHFEDMMVANCCAQYLWLEMEVIDNLIIIYEHEYTPSPCYCICNYPVDARIGPFEEGTYTVEVYEDFGGFIGSATVTIN
jgi:parallel beta-helix repeat protein